MRTPEPRYSSWYSSWNLSGRLLHRFSSLLCLAYENANPCTGIEIERKYGSRSYADDIALLKKMLEQAGHMLHCVESSADMVGLHLNTSKTELMALNTPGEDTKYLGSHLPSSIQDSNIRKVMAWDACNKFDCIWKSDLDRDLKIRFFRACIEIVLLFVPETNQPINFSFGPLPKVSVEYVAHSRPF